MLERRVCRLPSRSVRVLESIQSIVLSEQARARAKPGRARASETEHGRSSVAEEGGRSKGLDEGSEPNRAFASDVHRSGTSTLDSRLSTSHCSASLASQRHDQVAVPTRTLGMFDRLLVTYRQLATLARTIVCLGRRTSIGRLALRIHRTWRWRLGLVDARAKPCRWVSELCGALLL